VSDALEPRVDVEICVETLDAALAAEAGGAHRVELCANLAELGTTPDEALLARCVAALSIPIHPIVRVRPGSFVYGPSELAEMVRQVVRARGLGARGIVIGALTADGSVDGPATAALRDAAGSLSVTFHRAFDAVRDQAEALEALVDLGIDRVLTSGGAPTALEGADHLARLVQQANGRIRIMAGGSVRPHNARELIARTGVRDIHARLDGADEVRRLVETAVAVNRPPRSVEAGR